MVTWDVPLDRGSLAAALLRAADWCDDALLVRLHEAGWPSLSRGHAQVFVHLDPDGTPPAELARRIGITRQSAHTLVQHLEALGLLDLSPHPTDGRSRLVQLSPDGEALVGAAVRMLSEIEGVLADRIGADNVAALRRALGQPWGPPPTEPAAGRAPRAGR